MKNLTQKLIAAGLAIGLGVAGYFIGKKDGLVKGCKEGYKEGYNAGVTRIFDDLKNPMRTSIWFKRNENKNELEGGYFSLIYETENAPFDEGDRHWGWIKYKFPIKGEFVKSGNYCFYGLDPTKVCEEELCNPVYKE